MKYLRGLGCANLIDLGVSDYRLFSQPPPLGQREVEAMLAFCAAHGIVADVEVVRPDELNAALDGLRRNDVCFHLAFDIPQG